MSLDFSSVLCGIRGRITSGVPNVDVFDTHGEARRINGVLVPYIVLSLGGPIRAASGRGICGSAKDPHILWVHVACVSESSAQATSMKNQLLAAGVLVDYVPPGAGPLTLVGGYQDMFSSQDSSPVRFIDALRFNVTYNLTNL